VIEGIVTAPTVLRAAYARSPARHARRAAPPARGAAPPVTPEVLAAVLTPDGAAGPVPAETGHLARQQLGLATLFTLASAAASEAHLLDATVEVWRTGSVPALPPADLDTLDTLVALATTESAEAGLLPATSEE
jgi:hypothetical protein